MTSPLVSRIEALKKPTHHQFVPGIGYLVHSGAPEIPDGAKGGKNCKPADRTKDGSRHLLKPPGGHPPLLMAWVASEGAWSALKHGAGNRLAWTAEHLSAAGWEYLKPEPKA